MQQPSVCQITTFYLCQITLLFLLTAYSGQAQTPIAFGESLTQTLPTTSSTLTFSTPYSQPGDKLLIRIKPAGIQIKYELFSPTGQFVKVISGSFNALIEDIYSIPPNGEAGLYTILISNIGIWVGDFCISIERMNIPPSAVFLACGTSLISDLTCSSSIKSFRYLVQENTRSRITISTAPAPGAIAPEVWVCDRTGTVLSHGASGFNVPLVLDTIPAPDTGCYYVLVVDDTGIWDSDFSITHTILAGSCAAVDVQSSPVNAELCEGEDFTLTASSPLPGASYSWVGPNGFSSTQSQITIPNATTAHSGIYTVTVSTLTICSSTASKTITVNPLPMVAASVSLNTVCAGQSFMLDVTTNAAQPITYAWSGPNGYSSPLKSPTIAVPDTAPSALRVYVVTVTNGVTGCVNTSSVSVQVNAKPTADISLPTGGMVCLASTLFLHVTTNAQNATFLWSFPNGSSSTSQSPNIPNVMNIHAGTYFVTVTDGITGCTKTDSQQIIVNALPIANISVTPSSRKVCMGQPFTLNVTTNAPNPTFQWSGPNGYTSSQQTIVLTANTLLQSGLYSVMVTNGNTGCAKNVVDSITVNPLPITSISVVPPGGATEVCFGKNITLCANSTGQNLMYTWTGPNGYFSSSQCVSFANPNQSGFYMVTSKDGMTGCTSAPANQQINIYALPEVNILTVPADAIVCAGEPVTLCASSNTSDPTILWMGPGGFISTELCVTLTPPGPTHDAFFKVKITDNHGCSDSMETTVQVIEVELTVSGNGSSITASAEWGTPPYTYTLSPGGATNNNGLFTGLQPGTYTVSVEDQNDCGDSKTLDVTIGTVEPGVEWGLSLSPNPGNGLFDLSSTISAFPLQLTLFDNSGRQLRYFTMERAIKTLDLTDLTAGLYILRVSDGKNVGTMRLAIMK